MGVGAQPGLNPKPGTKGKNLLFSQPTPVLTQGNLSQRKLHKCKHIFTKKPIKTKAKQKKARLARMKCCKLILLTLNHNSKDQVSCDFDQGKAMRPPFVVHFGKDLCECSSGGGEVGLLTAQVVFHGRTASSLNFSHVSRLGTSPATLSVPMSMAGLHFDPQLWTALPASDCA